jgi:hypothetical protein
LKSLGICFAIRKNRIKPQDSDNFDPEKEGFYINPKKGKPLWLPF